MRAQSPLKRCPREYVSLYHKTFHVKAAIYEKEALARHKAASR